MPKEKPKGAKDEKVTSRYDARISEPKWQEFWEKNKINRFDPKQGKIFSIDTPPPYPSGEFHAGNILNWCYIDFVARYKRMKGFSVFFPQGWDVHGLPTEVKVEKWKGKKSGEVDRETWIKWCDEWTSKYIGLMKESIIRLGCSVDWTTEYKTSDPDYMRVVQLSFIHAIRDGHAYRGRHPVNWCPECRTAIADAEVVYKERDGNIWHVKFELAGGGSIIIATTRPELLCACVGIAVHPDDKRNNHLIGRRAVVPIFGQEVEIFGSETVDPKFGTGIVMICTFGDKADVDWVFKHGLPIVDAIDDSGQLMQAAGKYQGLMVRKAKEIVAKDLIESGLVIKTECLKQNVGVCWRCSNPIEILNKEQWFLKAVAFKEKLIEETKKVKWWPEYMVHRQVDWANSMTWDWVISRQKVYGTPFPLWYCDFCGETIIASADELPVDPVKIKKNCPKCRKPARPEIDTMDTWMDSSVTTYVHAGWPNKGWERFVPSSLQPNGMDIIRTWDYYLMLRSLMLTNKPPYENVLINGMVLGPDGRKMSKSLGNFVTFAEIIKKSYSDACRYWAARSIPGSNYPFSWAEIEHAEKFYTKLWNIFAFLKMALEKSSKKQLNQEELIKDTSKLAASDRWILVKLQKLIETVTEFMEKYTWPITEIENFVWHELADYYIEMIKHRIYNNQNAWTAILTLNKCLSTSIKLLAPFAPHITEEIYQNLPEREKNISIHISKWPIPDNKFKDDNIEKLGDMTCDIISAVRKFKMNNKMSLNAPIKELVIDSESLDVFSDDIKGTLKIENIKFEETYGMQTEKFGIWISINA